MLILRNLRWPDDHDALLAIDTSFTTQRVHRVVSTGTVFTMRDATVSPPLVRVFDLTHDIENIVAMDHVVIAEQDMQIVGLAALMHDTEDERALIRHIYVHRPYRGQGIGRALMNAMATQAERWQVRCMWLETQDVNYDAINFYQHHGFRWCGLDLSLDEHDGSQTDETAVFFMRNLK
jgi:ribosomal protein S18 acetylase RimI-like enzyme